jgi:hypothetical protein
MPLPYPDDALRTFLYASLSLFLCFAMPKTTWTKLLTDFKLPQQPHTHTHTHTANHNFSSRASRVKCWHIGLSLETENKFKHKYVLFKNFPAFFSHSCVCMYALFTYSKKTATTKWAFHFLSHGITNIRTSHQQQGGINWMECGKSYQKILH